MNNFKKCGYSVIEVAQILGVTPVTVRKKIDSGELGALIDGTIQKGRKRKIRVTREDLSEFIKNHESYYERETVKVFVNSFKNADKKTTISKESGEYAVDSISDLSGAWAGLIDSNKSAIKETEETLNKDNKSHSYKVLVDGRIMVCNVEKKTIQAIINALLEDSKFSPKNITIEYGE